MPCLQRVTLCLSDSILSRVPAIKNIFNSSASGCFKNPNIDHVSIRSTSTWTGLKCMPNMGKIVSSHSSNRLSTDDQQQEEEEGCNCRGGPDTCPLTPAECQKTNVIYVASVTAQGGVEHYTGLTGGTFKKRWDKHQSDIRLKRSKTTLSHHILKLEEEGKQYTTKREILDRALSQKVPTVTQRNLLLHV